MNHSPGLRTLVLALFFVFMIAAYMENQTGKTVYFALAGLAVFSSMVVGLLMARKQK